MQETQEALSEREEVAQETLSERKHDMQGALSDLEEETQEASLNPEVETQEIISEHAQDEAGPAAGSTEFGGPDLHALRKLTISGNHSPMMSSRTRSR